MCFSFLSADFFFFVKGQSIFQLLCQRMIKCSAEMGGGTVVERDVGEELERNGCCSSAERQYS